MNRTHLLKNDRHQSAVPSENRWAIKMDGGDAAGMGQQQQQEGEEDELSGIINEGLCWVNRIGSDAAQCSAMAC